MTEQIKRELKTFAQYFAIALVAGVGAFVTFMPEAGEGEFAVAVNIKEAWRNYQPVMRAWLVGFAFLGVIRLLLIHIIRHRRKHS